MKPRLQSRDGNFRAMRIRSFSGRPGLELEAISSTFFCGTRRFRFNGRSFMRMSFPLPIHWTTFMRCSLRTASSAARAVRTARAAGRLNVPPHLLRRCSPGRSWTSMKADSSRPAFRKFFRICWRSTSTTKRTSAGPTGFITPTCSAAEWMTCRAGTAFPTSLRRAAFR